MKLIGAKSKNSHDGSEKIKKEIKKCEKYREELISYCYSYFDFSYHDAEDCVQEAYTALYESLLRGIEIRNCKAWLFKVALNYKAKAVNETAKRRQQEFSDNEEKDLVLNNALFYNPDLIENMVSDETIEERAMLILSKLNEKEQYLYFAYYSDKKNLKEISEEMGISHAAVRQRIVGLRRKIIKYIKEYE